MYMSRTATIALYRQLIRASKGFANYNVREYAIRYVRDEFRAASALLGKDVRKHARRSRL